MPTVKLLGVQFDLPLKQYEVPAFRGGIIDLVGREHQVFHNHKGENKFHYRYPSIQYKVKNNNAYLLSLNEGVEELYSLFDQSDLKIMIGKEKKHINVQDIHLSKPFLQVWDQHFKYQINDWLPLNEKNFERFASIDREVDRLLFLEKILVGNLLSMGKGLNWTIDKKIEVHINKIKSEKSLNYKKVKLKGFVVTFTSNVFLPPLIGLGKGASTGFGVIHPLKSNNHHE